MMLKVSNLDVFYNESQAIRDISFEVAQGETLAIMGRNGMGKSTLLKALIGLMPLRNGSIFLNEQNLSAAKSFQRVIAGMAYVPQGRMIFPYLTVEENILVGMETVAIKKVPEWTYQYFPVLQEMKNRKGGNLSGGQQQQLAIARALVSNPKILLLDEPTEGIQPSIIKEIAQILNQLKKELNFSLIVTEQVLSFELEVADRLLIIEKGEIVHQETKPNMDLQKIASYLAV